MRSPFLKFVLALVLAPGLRADIPIVIETELGRIEAVLDEKQAPITVANLLKYVDAGHFDKGEFYRTVRTDPDNQPTSAVKIDVIQARANGKGKDAFPPIQIERTRETGLKHVNGALSMARTGPDTAQDEFFICIGDQPELDFAGKRNPDGQGFAAFGRVISGLAVVQQIQRSPFNGQQLTPPIRILSIRRK
ncbi:MAG TPA: peptidylprolyl isomerase [Bryobacteraceae bacterium]|nr:peptidylprolyl isomerase [Bryobacteraceae bacterium]